MWTLQWDGSMWALQSKPIRYGCNVCVCVCVHCGASLRNTAAKKIRDDFEIQGFLLILLHIGIHMSE